MIAKNKQKSMTIRRNCFDFEPRKVEAEPLQSNTNLLKRAINMTNHNLCTHLAPDKPAKFENKQEVISSKNKLPVDATEGSVTHISLNNSSQGEIVVEFEASIRNSSTLRVSSGVNGGDPTPTSNSFMWNS